MDDLLKKWNAFVSHEETKKQTPISNNSPPIKKNDINDKLSELRRKATDLTIKYPNAIRNATSIIDAVVNYYPYNKKNPLCLIKGGLSLINNIQNQTINNYYQFLNPAQGFSYLEFNKLNIGFLFIDVFSEFPKQIMTFVDGTHLTICKTSLGDIYLFLMGEENYIYYNQNYINKDELLKYLIDLKFKQLDSNFLNFHKDDEDLKITSINPLIKKSKKVNETIDYISKFVKEGLNRSILFYGPPGTGKTTMAFSLLSALNYRTLVFSASFTFNEMSIVSIIIDLLKVDAIIIDDFDQFDDNNKCLDLIEMFNKKCKVVIGVANSLKDFHPAILRPGRFDEIILVDQLDENCIIGVLGSLTDIYLNKVRKWPIAYIQELVNRSKFSSKDELKTHYEELNTRVQNQLEGLKF